jgi:small subunit ribosomal protein S14
MKILNQRIYNPSFLTTQASIQFILNMAKKSILIRELKRKKLVNLYLTKRKNLINKIKKSNSLEELLFLSEKLQKLPRNSSPVRLHNRCSLTGKSRSYYKFFGLCRIALRNLALDCLLPGITKASW